MNRKILFIGSAVLLIAASAAVASYVTRESLQPAPQQTATVQPAAQPHVQQAPRHPGQQRVASAQPSKPRCDDSNIVGTLAGGVGGGLVGSQIGGGNGKTVATIGGALGGAYLGNQFIPTRNVTCSH